jgi:hypothetical protein
MMIDKLAMRGARHVGVATYNRGRTWIHIYHIDDDVLHQFQGPQGREVVQPSHVYTILALLPVGADGRPRYRIKSKDENFVAEDLLSRSN